MDEDYSIIDDIVSDFFRWLDDEGYVNVSLDRQERIIYKYMNRGSTNECNTSENKQV